MESITINGREFKFCLHFISYGYDTLIYTKFFEGEETIKVSKYKIDFPKFWKRKLVENKLVTQPKYAFSIDADITDDGISKSWWRNAILNKIELLDRTDEIKRGEYI